MYGTIGITIANMIILFLTYKNIHRHCSPIWYANVAFAYVVLMNAMGYYLDRQERGKYYIYCLGNVVYVVLLAAASTTLTSDCQEEMLNDHKLVLFHYIVNCIISTIYVMIWFCVILTTPCGWPGRANTLPV
jgi:hypothetical protein